MTLTPETVLACAEAALTAQPPAFPLHATVAVNPAVGYTELPFPAAAGRLRALAGAPFTAPRETVRQALREGKLLDEDLKAALAESASALSPAQLKTRLWQSSAPPEPLPTVLDLAEILFERPWRQGMEDCLGPFALSLFDGGQAAWSMAPGAPLEQLRGWLAQDLEARRYGVSVEALPGNLGGALAWCIEDLAVPEAALPAYLERLLYTLGGWAQHARWYLWAKNDPAPGLALLLGRLLWERAALAKSTTLQAPWEALLPAYETVSAGAIPPGDDEILQLALDLAAQRRVCGQLSTPTPAIAARRPALQAVFCIDVRSEPLRRALEAQDPAIETLGFAGFFGLPVAHGPGEEARCPVLLSPTVRSEPGAPPSLGARLAGSLDRLSALGASALAYVEALGFAHGAALLGADRRAPAPLGAPPRWDQALPLGERITMAATILRALGLGPSLAPQVLLVGHGADLSNNAFASAYQCGACGGHDGGVSARLAAALLNDPSVRAGLAEEGLPIPEDSCFLAGIHDTASATLRVFPESEVQLTPAARAQLAAWLERASAEVQNAQAQGLPGAQAATLGARARHWAQLRPEWGLAGAQAFIAAPRAVTQGLDLQGRCFLHSYDAALDPEFKTLELILTAPVVVASWISLHYYGVTVAPEVLGSGNKLLHNVAGRLGVFEGGRSWLRTGLPLQAVHDGVRSRHTPLRLAVYLEAPEAAVLRILERHPAVKALFDHQWLFLYRLEVGVVVARYRNGAFEAPASATEQAA